MSNVENVCPQVLRGVSRELRRLAANPPAGIKLVLRDDDLTDVVAHIEGPADTPYFGGVFRVRLVLGREFPTAPPRAYFLTKLFHPNVAPDSGEVCVNTLKRDWRPELGLEHALLAVKCLLIAPNAESALNADAAAMLRDRYDDYFARAKLLTDIHARPAARHRAAPPLRSSPRRESSGSEAESVARESVAWEGVARDGVAREGPAREGTIREGSTGEEVREGAAREEVREGPCAKRERRPAPRAPASKDKRRVLKRL